ncbi:MAG: hypothetical protein AAGA96_06805 [Verrucomicrobiota bacterium]
MEDDKVLFALAKLNTALESDLSDLKRQANELSEEIEKAKSIPGIGDQIVDEFTALESSFESLSAVGVQLSQLAESEGVASSSESQSLWERVARENESLKISFEKVRAQGDEFVEGNASEFWDGIWKSIDLKLALVISHVTLAQTRMEMRDKYGTQKTDRLSKEIAEYMPANADLADATAYANEYRTAYKEIEERKETVGGFFDVFKSLLMIQDDSPDDMAAQRLANRKAID